MPDPTITRNSVRLSRKQLDKCLDYFSQCIAEEIPRTRVRLVVHGGSCMLLHPALSNFSRQTQRRTTRDVDIIYRGFVAEYTAAMADAGDRLKRCIQRTAAQMGIGEDWMNWDADVALPMALHPTTHTVYDPIYKDSVQPNNIAVHTIYDSPNGALTLISVTPFWAVALKLARYSQGDAEDICALLRNGTQSTQIAWTAPLLYDWITTQCWPMGYSKFDATRLDDLRRRVSHVVDLMNLTTPPASTTPTPPATYSVRRPSSNTQIASPLPNEALPSKRPAAVRIPSDGVYSIQDLERERQGGKSRSQSRPRQKIRQPSPGLSSSSSESDDSDTDSSSDDSDSGEDLDEGAYKAMRMSAIYQGASMPDLSALRIISPPPSHSPFPSSSGRSHAEPPSLSRLSSAPLSHPRHPESSRHRILHHHSDSIISPMPSNNISQTSTPSPRSTPSPHRLAAQLSNNNNVQKNWAHISQVLPHFMS